MADGYAVARAEQAVRRARLSATTQSSGGRSKVYLMPTMGSSSPRQVVYAPNGIGQGHTERVMLASESPLDTVPRSSNASMASLREKFEARESSPSPFIARKTASNASSRQEHRVGGGHRRASYKYERLPRVERSHLFYRRRSVNTACHYRPVVTVRFCHRLEGLRTAHCSIARRKTHRHCSTPLNQQGQCHRRAQKKGHAANRPEYPHGVTLHRRP